MNCDICLENKDTKKCSRCVLKTCDDCLFNTTKLECPYCCLKKELKVYVDNIEVPKDKIYDIITKNGKEIFDSYIISNFKIVLDYNGFVASVIDKRHNLEMPIRQENIFHIFFGDYPTKFIIIQLLINIFLYSLLRTSKLEKDEIFWFLFYFPNMGMFMSNYVNYGLKICNAKGIDETISSNISLIISKLKNNNILKLIYKND